MQPMAVTSPHEMQSGAILENRISSGPQYERALRPERLRSYAAQVTDHGGNGGSRRWADSWRGSNNICLEVIHIEEWKPVRGYEGLYEVSNYGRVRSEAYENRQYPIIRKFSTNQSGYYFVCLKKGKHRTALVHRLVAEAFIPNPMGLPEINHKDENKKNNNVENLEWCTRQYNQTYNNLNKRLFNKPIKQISVCGDEVSRYDSITEASITTGIHMQNISKALRGEQKSAGGFRWEYL